MSLGVYLGNPLSPFGMTLLPMPPIGGAVASGGANGITSVLSRGTTSNTLASGGTASFRRPKTKQSYTIAWDILTPSEVEVINSFFDGGQGGGPYCFVDPSWGNYLPPNVSRMGAVLSALPEWSPTAGAFGPITTVAAPAGRVSGVANWSGATTSSILYMGLNNIVDGTWLPPVIPGLSHGFAIWARTATGTATVTPSMLYGLGGSAPAGTAATGSAGSLTTTWQQISVQAPSSTSWSASADYVMLALTCSTVTAPNIYLAASEFVYSTAASASVMSPWAGGLGVPRVVIPSTVTSPVDMVGWRDYTLILAEA